MNCDEKAINREQEISKISRGLKHLAQELDIPVIALSQLSRENTKNITWENGPQLYTLRESGAIEADADVVMMLWGASDSEENEDAKLAGKRKSKNC